jgi:hypothetical protein
VLVLDVLGKKSLKEGRFNNPAQLCGSLLSSIETLPASGLPYNSGGKALGAFYVSWSPGKWRNWQTRWI